MKITKVIFIGILFIGSLFSCKKDPQEQVAKSWKAISYKVNGKEQMSPVSTQQSYASAFCNTTFNYTTTQTLKTHNIDIRTDGTYILTQFMEASYLDPVATENNCAVTMVTSTYNYSENGTWSITSDGKQITLVYSPGTGGSVTKIYEILELKRKSMKWKRTENNGDVVEINFVL